MRLGNLELQSIKDIGQYIQVEVAAEGVHAFTYTYPLHRPQEIEVVEIKHDKHTKQAISRFRKSVLEHLQPVWEEGSLASVLIKKGYIGVMNMAAYLFQDVYVIANNFSKLKSKAAPTGGIIYFAKTGFSPLVSPTKYPSDYLTRPYGECTEILAGNEDKHVDAKEVAKAIKSKVKLPIHAIYVLSSNTSYDFVNMDMEIYAMLKE